MQALQESGPGSIHAIIFHPDPLKVHERGDKSPEPAIMGHQGMPWFEVGGRDAAAGATSPPASSSPPAGCKSQPGVPRGGDRDTVPSDSRAVLWPLLQVPKLKKPINKLSVRAGFAPVCIANGQIHPTFIVEDRHS